MATKTIHENFVNNFGTDLLMAYFDPGADRNGKGRYNFASYSICNDHDWLKAIGALRNAACLFKLPVDASAAVEIVIDTDNPEARVTFSVQVQRSAHLLATDCNHPANERRSDAAKSAVATAQQAIDDALQTLNSELPLVTEAAEVPPPPKPICSLTEPCGGKTSTSCSDPINTVAACIQPSPGNYQVVCVPRVPPN
ncbi:MAG: hypothetical protein SFV81_06815 [Pirellulaceae bacterium]|nr:hypothetical protein [Pirellulaceae bacterium]